MPSIRLLPICLSLVIMFPTVVSAAGAQQATNQNSADADLEKYPEYYRKRIKAFRNIIRSQKTKEAKIRAALKLASDPNSDYRKDSIRFLVEVNAKETVPQLADIARKHPELRDEVVVAMSKFQTKDAIDYLIESLLDESKAENVRSIAVLNLRNITNQNFGYRADDVLPSRKEKQQMWHDWWKNNRETFKKQEVSQEDREEADEIWQKYGLQYLNRS